MLSNSYPFAVFGHFFKLELLVAVFDQRKRGALTNAQRPIQTGE